MRPELEAVLEAYFCTGSHDWSGTGFALIVKPITIEDRAWIAARAVVGPGVTLGEGSVLSLGSIATRDLEPWSISSGNPAVGTKIRPRP